MIIQRGFIAYIEIFKRINVFDFQPDSDNEDEVAIFNPGKNEWLIKKAKVGRKGMNCCINLGGLFPRMEEELHC